VEDPGASFQELQISRSSAEFANDPKGSHWCDLLDTLAKQLKLCQYNFMELPSGQVMRAVIQRYARLVTRLEDELGERPLVLPNGSFFPDRFLGDEASVQQLVKRMQQHAGIRDIPVNVRVVTDGVEPDSGSNCSSGACGVPTVTGRGIQRLVDEGSAWTLQLLDVELKHPVVLSTNIARSLAYVFLMETQDEEEIIEPPVDITADMTGVALGLGTLLLQGSYIYAKSCGGPSIACVTKLSCPELAVALAAFIARGDHSVRSALKELDTTQRTLLSEAHALFESNRHIVHLLRDKPATLASGSFDLNEAKPWLSRVFGRKKQITHESPLDALAQGADLSELENMLTEMPPSSAARRPSRPPKAPDELKDLVAEAFGSTRAEAE
jgi:hypothetical protein